jgi:glycerophosphoryl diester phosphodiesterase
MPPDPYLALLLAARAHAEAHGALTPVFAPEDITLLGENPRVSIAAIHQAGFRVVSWTTDDPATMHDLIALRVDGIISDRPDLLQHVVTEEKTAQLEAATYFSTFDVVGHRGARGLRPENTLPAFEAGLDHLVTALETDIGITSDRVCLICHDQFLSPRCCRRVDGTPYTLENRIYIRDVSLAEVQSTFICDKLQSGQFPDQANDLALSPVSVGFAEREGLISPYVPIRVEQLFRFTHFYADYYRTGRGKSHPKAPIRAANADGVCFNIETKILPLPNDPEGRSVATLPLPAGAEPTTNHTVAPEAFVATLCGAIQRNLMQDRARILSFDFRVLQRVEEQFPRIPTYYLTESAESLSTLLLPPSLRRRSEMESG